MHHFFVNPEQVEDGLIRITGSDVNHIKNVLRIRQGEEMLVSDGTAGITCVRRRKSPDWKSRYGFLRQRRR